MPQPKRSSNDSEAWLDEADATAARFFRAPSADALRAWRACVTNVLEPVDDPRCRARLTAHGALLQAVSSHGLDDPEARVAWAAKLGRDAVVGASPPELVRGLGIMLLSTFASPSDSDSDG